MTITDIIDEELELFAEKLITELENKANNDLPQASGKGAKSLRQEVIQKSSGEIAQALFQFEGYLRYFDMRKPKYDKRPDQNAIAEWIEEIGTEKFEAGYIRKYGAIPKDRTQFINKLVYGITSKIVKRKKRKSPRKKWYSTTINRHVYEGLYRNLLDRLADFTIAEIKEELSKKSA